MKDRASCWVLADGLGGHRGGEIASRFAKLNLQLYGVVKGKRELRVNEVLMPMPIIPTTTQYFTFTLNPLLPFTTPYIGCIMLSGIVVNNAILLADQAGQLIAGGMTVREAVAEAGRRRLRLILMTTLTTSRPVAAGIRDL